MKQITQHNAKRGPSVEQHRGGILGKRRDIINQFVTDQEGTGMPFGAYMKKKGVTKAMFFEELPNELHFEEIGEETPDSDALKDYGQMLNLLYHYNHVRHLAKADGFNCCGADGDLSEAIVTATDISYDDGFYDAGGKWKKKWKAAKTKVEGKVKKTIDKTKGKVKGIADKIKKQGLVGTLNKANPGMVAMRGAFQALLVVNAFAMAWNLGRIKDAGGKRWSKLMKKWRVVGGDENRLIEIIQRNRNKKPVFGQRNADGMFSLTGAEVSAFIAQATPIMALVLPVIKQFKKDKGEPEGEGEIPDLPTVPPLDPGTEDALDDAGADDPSPDGEETFFEMYKIPILIGGALVVAGIVTAIVVSARKG